MIRTVELPMPQRNANGVVPVTELPSPAPAPLIKADAASYRHAPRVASEATRPAQREATELVRHLVPQRFDSARPSGWAVQLGAYDSLAIAKEKWGVLKKRNDVLAAFPASSHAATVRSEEHTSELQSLMRISYAVFCLKKKNPIQHLQNKLHLSKTK